MLKLNLLELLFVTMRTIVQENLSGTKKRGKSCAVSCRKYPIFCKILMICTGFCCNVGQSRRNLRRDSFINFLKLFRTWYFRLINMVNIVIKKNIILFYCKENQIHVCFIKYLVFNSGFNRVSHCLKALGSSGGPVRNG